MTGWTAPERPDVPLIGSERELLESWLDWHRNTLLAKTAGLTGEQLCARSCPPSNLSLLGLLRHMADVERGWFVRTWQPSAEPIYYDNETDPDGDLDNTDPETAFADLKIYLAEMDEARREAARHEIDEVVENTRSDGVSRRRSVRWIYLHMIEEYARHNGHADLLREAIDGATGD